MLSVSLDSLEYKSVMELQEIILHLEKNVGKSCYTPGYVYSQ